MISVEEARQLIMRHTGHLPVKEVPLDQAWSHFSASDIVSPNDHPLFDNSAVDGYAFAFDPNISGWNVVGSIAAGSASKRSLKTGECARIFTGAMLPAGTDTVVMQEFVQLLSDHITHSDQKLERGSNVRRKGEQIKVGQVILHKGDAISAAASGLLASVGVQKLKVHEWPYVSIVITGDEFTTGTEEGRIFSSNDLMLAAALRKAGFSPRIFHSHDDQGELENTLRQALSFSDIVITTGGVSVGEHDLVATALQRIGATIIFHKVAQKPGKPMLFAIQDRKLIFGLPGNPRAVMILFWEYVLPAIRAMMGARDPGPRKVYLKINERIQLKGERSEFRAAKVANGKVELLSDQGSHMLSGLVAADALVYFSQHRTTIEPGTEVEVHPITADE